MNKKSVEASDYKLSMVIIATKYANTCWQKDILVGICTEN